MAMEKQEKLELTDRFAAHALEGILANNAALAAITGSGPGAILTKEQVQAIARKAYDVAEAMVTERSDRIRLKPEPLLKKRDLQI